MKLTYRSFLSKLISNGNRLKYGRYLLLQLRFRMRFFVDILELFYRIMGVDLGGREACMAKQFLHRLQGRAVIC